MGTPGAVVSTPRCELSTLYYCVILVDVSLCHKRSVKKINASHISSYSFYGWTE
jgi:hypothetical protein